MERLCRHYTRPGRAELGAAGGLVVYGLAQLEADDIDGDEALHVLDQMCGADAVQEAERSAGEWREAETQYDSDAATSRPVKCGALRPTTEAVTIISHEAG